MTDAKITPVDTRRRGLAPGTAIRSIQYSGTIKENGVIALTVATRANVLFRVSHVHAQFIATAPTLISVAIRGTDNEDWTTSPIKLVGVNKTNFNLSQLKSTEPTKVTESSSLHAAWITNHGTIDAKYIVNVTIKTIDFQPAVTFYSLDNVDIVYPNYDNRRTILDIDDAIEEHNNKKDESEPSSEQFFDTQ